MEAAETGLCSFQGAVWTCEGSSRDTWSLEGPGHLPLKSLVGGNPSARSGGGGRCWVHDEAVVCGLIRLEKRETGLKLMYSRISYVAWVPLSFLGHPLYFALFLIIWGPRSADPWWFREDSFNTGRTVKKWDLLPETLPEQSRSSRPVRGQWVEWVSCGSGKSATRCPCSPLRSMLTSLQPGFPSASRCVPSLSECSRSQRACGECVVCV